MKTENHKLYGQYLHDRNLDPVIAIGSAGTGKTYGAVGAAIDWLQESPNHIFIGSRPNVAFADEIGYLPGTEEEKIGPWVRPIKQNFNKHGMDDAYIQMMEKTKRIRFYPLAFIQGLTFDNAFVLIDECQNMTFSQLKGVLTRTGENTRVVLCGDVKQTSTLFQGSGLQELVDMVQRLGSACRVVEFTHHDILRSEKCKRWIMDFEKWQED